MLFFSSCSKYIRNVILWSKLRLVWIHGRIPDSEPIMWRSPILTHIHTIAVILRNIGLYIEHVERCKLPILTSENANISCGCKMINRWSVSQTTVQKMLYIAKCSERKYCETTQLVTSRPFVTCFMPVYVPSWFLLWYSNHYRKRSGTDGGRSIYKHVEYSPQI